jgi:hypothetical protein
MAMVNTVGGGQLDVGRGIVHNINPAVLFDPNPRRVGWGNDDTGEVTGLMNSSAFAAPAGPLIASGPQRAASMGAWFKVPDQNFYFHDRNGINDYVVWELPNSNQIIFDENALTIQYSRDLISNPFSSKKKVTNVSVRVSAKTIPGLVAMGFVTQGQANDLLGIVGEPKTEPTGIQRVLGSATEVAKDLKNTADKTQNTVRLVTGGVVVVAAIIAAIVFLPKG